MSRFLALCGALSLAFGILAWAAQEVQDASSDPAPDPSAARAARRSFTGAPPTIPHKVYRRDNKECLHCHLEVRKTPYGISNVTPHPEFTNCQQCHVQQNPEF